MQTLPLTILQWVLFTWVFWYLYVLVMGLYRAYLQGRLTKTTYYLALPAVIVGYAFDIFANLTIATVLFLDLPREGLVTARLQRYMKLGTGRRFTIAKWICDNLLDPFDPHGKHC